MTFTYSAAELTTTLARVRLKIGDTDRVNQLLQDEEINVVIEETDDINVVALDCCRLILAKLARDIDTSGASINVSRSQKTQHYRDLIAILERNVLFNAQPTVGGLSQSARDATNNESDFIKPKFTTDMDECS